MLFWSARLCPSGGLGGGLLSRSALGGDCLISLVAGILLGSLLGG